MSRLTARMQKNLHEALEAIDNAEQTENPLYWTGIARGRIRDVLGLERLTPQGTPKEELSLTERARQRYESRAHSISWDDLDETTREMFENIVEGES